MSDDWYPAETAPYGKCLMVWWIPIDENPYAEMWTIGRRVYQDDDVETEQGVAKTGNWWISGRYYEPRHVTHWRRLPPAPDGRPSEAMRMAELRRTSRIGEMSTDSPAQL